MMNVRNRTSATVLGGAFLLATTAASAETLRLNHNNPEDHPTGISLERMADRVAELTDGEITIRVSHNAQLGSQRESTELVQQGSLAMARSNASELEAFVPLYGVLNLPFLFTSEQHYYDVLTSDVGQTILDASEDSGFVGLAFFVEGARSFYANEPIESPDDLEGMQIRVQPSPSAIRMVELLGASPTPIDYGELYSALQQGVVDGAENNPLALTSARHGEVVSHFSMNEHTMIPSVVFISTEVWDGLSEDHQDAIRQASREVMDFHREQWNTLEAEGIAEAEEEMGVTFVEVDKEPFIEAVLPMHEELADESEEFADLIERIKEMAD